MSMGLVLVLPVQSKKLKHFRLTGDSGRCKQRTHPRRFALANDGQKISCVLHVGDCLKTSLQKSVVVSLVLPWRPDRASSKQAAQAGGADQAIQLLAEMQYRQQLLLSRRSVSYSTPALYVTVRQARRVGA